MPKATKKLVNQTPSESDALPNWKLSVDWSYTLYLEQKGQAQNPYASLLLQLETPF